MAQFNPIEGSFYMNRVTMNSTRCLTSAILASLTLAGCGGGSDFSSPSYTVGGTVSGLNSSTSVQLMTADPTNTVTVSQDGSFKLPVALSHGSSYAVTVAQQPSNQTCTVTKGAGSNLAADVADISVTCITNTYTVAGTVSGLGTGAQVTLSNNGTETAVVSSDGSFSFATPVQAYAVTVATQPTNNKTCTVSNGSGTATANVSNVTVSCVDKTFSISGTVTGLGTGEQVTLSNNGTESAVVSTDGSFSFATPVQAYAVTVATQPSNKTCTVSNASGTATANVSNVSVSCVANGFTIAGTVSGLGTGEQVTLSNNGAETAVVSADGSFSFATPVQAYAVTVATQPTGSKYCSVSNGAGTASSNVSNVSVSCVAVSYLNCPTNKALTGIQGRKGGIIDQLQIRCADIVSASVDTSTTAAGNFAGGGGGSPFGPFTCPSGEWISGVSGYNGIYSYPTAMASVQVTCSGGSQSPSYNFGGSAAFSYTCPAGKRATGFVIGSVGGYTGFMKGITCEP